MDIIILTLKILSVILPVLCILQWLIKPVRKQDMFLGIAMISICCGIFQSLHFFLPQAQRLNILLLLPLKTVFLPLWCTIQYLNTSSGIAVTGKRLDKFIFFAIFAEFTVYLLPIGALIFLQSYSRPILDYLFRLQTAVYFAFLATSLSAAFSFSKRHLKSQNFRVEASTMAAIVVISVLAFMSVLMPALNLTVLPLFYIPQILSALALSVLSVHNLRHKHEKTYTESEDISVVPTGISETVFANVRQIIYDNKLYLNPDLRITDIAQRMSLSPNYLSKLINEASGEGFNDMVNRMRIESVMEKINDNSFSNKTLFSIAVDSGFRSRSTFNSSFKKITNMTPAEYKRNTSL